MNESSSNFIKDYFLEKMLNARLYFLKEKPELTDFFERVKHVKNLLIIVPRDRAEEVQARKYVSRIHEVFKPAKFSTLDVCSLRKTDVDWLGVPNKTFLDKMKSENFDLIIDLNSSHDHLCTYLGAFIEAPLRLHITEGKFDKVYNLHIRAGDTNGMESKIKNMINYLTRIRQMDHPAS